jgi:diguanylate cyclase (GGDEF)-like protein
MRKFRRLLWLTSDSDRAAPRYVWRSLGACVVGLALALGAALATGQRERELAQLELNGLANGYALTLQFGISTYMRKIDALRTLFDTVGTTISRDQFATFTKQLLSDQIAILGMAWLPRVPRDQREAHERAGAREGIPDYHIKSIQPDGTRTRAPDRDEHFPIFYAATEALDSPVYGLDLNDGDLRQRALEAARDDDRPAASSHFALRGNRVGFLMVAPVYRPDAPHQTVPERRENLIGFVQAFFEISVLLESIINTTTGVPGLDVYFFPPEAADTVRSGALQFDGARARVVSLGSGSQRTLAADLHWSGPLSVGDAAWTMVAVPIAGGPVAPSYVRAWIVLICGILLTGAIATYIWRTGKHAERLRTSNHELDLTLGMLSTQNVRFDTAINNIVQGFVMFDAAERVIVCNHRFVEMYKLSPELIKPGCSFRDVLRHRAASGLFRADPEDFRNQLLPKLAEGNIVQGVVTTTDGRDIFVINKPMPGGGWTATHEDVTERRKAEARISHMALHDELTDLPNRHLFGVEVEKHLAWTDIGQKFAVLCLDLDHFKNVNDTFGHPFGDKLLKQVGSRLRSFVRQSDAVSRFGGDEFAILQGDLEGRAETAALAARIVDAVGAPFDLDGHQVVIGVSIGIAFAPTDGTDAVQLLKAADLALYRAKADGRSTFRFFEPGMDRLMQARTALEADLRKALANQEFTLHYQPVVSLQTGRINGFEALIRWNHPHRGMIAPAEFISIAEETALIVPIGDWVLRTACEEASRWPDDVRVAVNLSSVQFRVANLYESVMEALERSNLAADRLEIEITESVILLNLPSTLETLNKFRARGVKIAMDDFGTGHSSLSYLRHYPFDRIKLDGSFIRDLADKMNSRAIVRAIAELANSLRIGTTAEGIETQEQLDYVKRVGCTEGQGYLFGKPQPAKEARALLALQSSLMGHAQTELVAD